MAVLLALAAAVLLAVSVLVDPSSSMAARLVQVGAQWTGPVLVAALVLHLFRRRWAARVRSMLVDVAGPALIRSMPPRAVLEALLPAVYGERVGHHQEVLTAILGGGGRDPGGGDTAVSRHSRVYVRLEHIGGGLCRSELTWTHEFSGVRNNHLFVIFATPDRDIAGLIPRERVYPLFELWQLDDDDELEEFVPTMLSALKFGITYRDVDGVEHTVTPRPQLAEEVAFGQYDRFVRLHGGVDRKDLRILQLDLHELADPDHVVDAVESLTLVASTVASFDLGYVTWSPPHPCYVARVRFDVGGLRSEGALDFLVVSSTIVRAGLPLRGWSRYDEVIDVAVDSWMLPGHGVTLLWRPTNGAES